MSTPMSDVRRRKATEGLAGLGAEPAGHEVLSVQCARSHHVATVFDTEAGLVFGSITGPHAHGRKDRGHTGHDPAHQGAVYVELLDSTTADEMLPAWCDCGTWSVNRREVLADVRAGKRTTHLGPTPGG